MVLDKYKKQLTRFEGKIGTTAYWTILFTPVFFIIIATLNLWSAARLGDIYGASLSDIKDVMFMEINPKQEYPFSGMLLLTIQRLETSIYQYIFSLPLLGNALAMYFERKRNREVLKVLRKHREI